MASKHHICEICGHVDETANRNVITDLPDGLYRGNVGTLTLSISSLGKTLVKGVYVCNQCYLRAMRDIVDQYLYRDPRPKADA